jgi:2-polyprenyl-3-methyl-5-hydroxy-6-metoxy-1,4-benzoquinol methylase
MAATEMEWKGRTGPFDPVEPGVFSPRTQPDGRRCARDRPDDTVIDVGCGSGCIVRRGTVSAKRVIGCDISEEAVEAATARSAWGWTIGSSSVRAACSTRSATCARRC